MLAGIIIGMAASIDADIHSCVEEALLGWRAQRKLVKNGRRMDGFLRCAAFAVGVVVGVMVPATAGLYV